MQKTRRLKAERGGFEPPVALTGYADLANRSIRPLWHLSGMLHGSELRRFCNCVGNGLLHSLLHKPTRNRPFGRPHDSVSRRVAGCCLTPGSAGTAWTAASRSYRLAWAYRFNVNVIVECLASICITFGAGTHRRRRGAGNQPGQEPASHINVACDIGTHGPALLPLFAFPHKRR